jgi:Lipid A 3-O-deacylase (PagL)
MTVKLRRGDRSSLCRRMLRTRRGSPAAGLVVASRSAWVPLILALLSLSGALLPLRTASADALEAAWCGRCDLMLGVGTTYFDFGLTHGLVLPVALEFDQSRWELGAFRFATDQQVDKHWGPPDGRAANPYWGFTAMRRWQVIHRGWGRIYLGFGANYRTANDYLEVSHWNFAYLIAARFDVGVRGTALELGIRHWSDAWIKRPNRGQDLATISVVF